MRKTYLIFIGLLITILNYSQQDGKYDYLDVNEELTVRDTAIIDLIEEHTSGATVGGANGLSKSGNNIKLGGSTLDEDVLIPAAGYGFKIGTTLSAVDAFEFIADGNFEVTSDEMILTVGGIAWTFDGTYWISAGGDTLQDGDEVNAKILAALPYVPFSFDYIYSPTITDSRPGAGYFRLNNATYSNVTEIYIDAYDINSVNKSKFISLPDTGSYISISDGTNFINYQLTGELITASSYYKYEVTYLNHTGVIAGNCGIGMDLSNNVGSAAADLLYFEYGQVWLAKNDTITIQDSTTYADTADYANFALYSDTTNYSVSGNYALYSDTANYSNNGIYALYSDSAKYADTSGLVRNIDSVRIIAGTNEYVFKGDTGFFDTNNIKLKNLYATDNVQADTHKFGTNNYMIDAPQNNILEWDVANSYYRPFTSETDGAFYSGTTEPDLESSSRLNYNGELHGSQFVTSWINIIDGDEDDGLYYSTETDPRFRFSTSGSESVTTFNLPNSSQTAILLSNNTSTNDNLITLLIPTTPGINEILLQSGDLKTKLREDVFYIIDYTDTLAKIDQDSIIFGKAVSAETTLSIGDSLKHADGSWITGATDAQAAIEIMEFEKLQFDTSEHTYTEGTLFYDKHEKSMSLYNDVSGFKEELGRGVNVRFYNNTGGTLTNGTVIRSTGAQVNSAITFTAGVAGNGSLDSLQGVAMVTADVATGNYGMATLVGQVNWLNTSAYTDNQLLYVGSGGTYIDTIPPPPNYAYPFARVAYADADSGAIYIFPYGSASYNPVPTISASFTRETETITNPGINTPALITNVTNDLYTTDYNAGFSVVGDSINPSQDGAYDIKFSYAFQGDAATGDDWRIGIFINGVELHTVLRTSSASNKGVVASFKVKPLTTSDWVTLKVINTTSATRDAIFTDGAIDITYISKQ